tara:strand:+ start:56 stop:484 length:429 start_codon:yes stop_codon:yes gene_type:complete
MERPTQLSEKQVLAAQALAAGFTWEQASKRAKCSTGAILKWKKTEAFNNAIWEYQQEIFHRSFGVTSEALPEAIQKLREIIDSEDPAIAVNVKVQAIKILIDSAHKQFEARYVERRIEHLEADAKRQTLNPVGEVREITGAA